MVKRAIALVAALAALQAAAPAPQAMDNCVAWANSWDEAKTEAMERNVPILFTIQQDENPACQQMENAFRDGSFIAASRRAVCVVSNTDTKHGVRDIMVRGKKTPFCRAYDGMPCETHTRCQSAIPVFHKAKTDTVEIPTQIWCKPDGTELFRFSGPQGTGGQSAAALVKDLERALDRVSGSHLSRKEWEEIKTWLRQGDEAQARHEYKIVLKNYKAVMDCKHEKFAKQGKDKYEAYIKQCVVLVSKALKQYEKYARDTKESKEVKPLLTKIAKEMKGTEAGTAAEDALKQIK